MTKETKQFEAFCCALINDFCGKKLISGDEDWDRIHGKYMIRIYDKKHTKMLAYLIFLRKKGAIRVVDDLSSKEDFFEMKPNLNAYEYCDEFIMFVNKFYKSLVKK